MILILFVRCCFFFFVFGDFGESGAFGVKGRMRVRMRLRIRVPSHIEINVVVFIYTLDLGAFGCGLWTAEGGLQFTLFSF